jgi:hypothetical protein
MKTIFFGLLLLLNCTLLCAQRLYVHDIFNGNYRSYDIGDQIELVLLDSSKTIKAEITGLASDRLYLKDSGIVMLQQIAGVIERKSRVNPARILGFGAAYSLSFIGGLYAIGGIILVKTDPEIGVVSLGVGGIMLGGGVLLLKKLNKKGGLINQMTIDDTTHRIFVE